LASNGGLTQTRSIGGGSPALNLVTSGCPPPSTDQRGVARPTNACDAGAYEAGGAPSIAIGNTSVTEGNGGTTPATFTVSLSAAASQTVTVQFATSNGSASAGSDYNATSG